MSAEAGRPASTPAFTEAASTGGPAPGELAGVPAMFYLPQQAVPLPGITEN